MGRVAEVNQVAQGGRQNVVIDYTLADYGWSPEWPSEATSLPPSANAVRPGDIVCKLKNAGSPMIIRPHVDYFSVVMITVSLKRPLLNEKPAVWMTKSFLLVWDWTHGASGPDAKFYVLVARHDLDHGLDDRLRRGFDMASVFLEKPATLARPVDSPNHVKIQGLLSDGVKLAEKEYGRNDRKTVNVKIRTALYDWDVRKLREVRAKLRRLMEKRLRVEGLYPNLMTDLESSAKLYRRELEVIKVKHQRGDQENHHACSLEEDGLVHQIMFCELARSPKKHQNCVSQSFGPRIPDINDFLEDYRAIRGLMDIILTIKGDGLEIKMHLMNRMTCYPLGGDMMWYIYSCGLETRFPEPDKALLLRAAACEGQGDLMLEATSEGHNAVRLKIGDLEDLLLAGANNKNSGSTVVGMLLSRFVLGWKFMVTKEVVISAASNVKHGELILRQLLDHVNVDTLDVTGETLRAVTKMGKHGQAIMDLLLEFDSELEELEKSRWRLWLGRSRH